MTFTIRHKLAPTLHVFELPMVELTVMPFPIHSRCGRFCPVYRVVLQWRLLPFSYALLVTLTKVFLKTAHPCFSSSSLEWIYIFSFFLPTHQRRPSSFHLQKIKIHSPLMIEGSSFCYYLSVIKVGGILI